MRLSGAAPVLVNLECNIQDSGIGIHLVGLADVAVKESLLRTVTALQANGYRFPGTKTVINLAPADLYKTGSGFDLAIALSVIDASMQRCFKDLDQWLVLGELGLDGTLRDVPGALQAALATRDNGLKGCIVPQASVYQFAELIRDEVPVYGAASLADAVTILEDPEAALTAWDWYCMQPDRTEKKSRESVWPLLKGQPAARRAVEIAAAGGHSLLIVGAPGTGKCTVAKALAELLPPMKKDEALETAAVWSAAGRAKDLKERPFRAPHISCSKAALLGGGAGDNIQPGEVSLAHNGVLLLDEASEMPKTTQEALRGPLEDGKVTISRLRSKVEYPSRLQLVCATNPCPCGYYGEGDRCTCTSAQRAAYLSRLSGPVYDRLTVQLWTRIVPPEIITKCHDVEPVEQVAERVRKAREMQAKRYAGTPFQTNEEVTSAFAEKYFVLGHDEKELMEKLIDRLGLSARAYSRILKMARTIADLEGKTEIQTCHLAEAAGLRFLDRRDYIYA